MSKITKVEYKKGKNRDRVWVYIDNKYCTSIRKRTFDGMKIGVGTEITCEELKTKENFFFKQSYGEISWKKEKVRLEKVREYIKGLDDTNSIDIKTIGFGADSEVIIEKHPDESGSPDLGIINKLTKDIFMYVEVSGTERKLGQDYWIRPDKLAYSKRHLDKDIWIILHYQLPNEEYVIIKPDNEKTYKYEEVKMKNGATEYYVKFNNGDEEIKSIDEFKLHLLSYIK
ncbi:hypothetical protein [Paraclostridium bifermentans]|uniref:hypothetical protein n=1 Tax=Paraclostridium bifermentans TaxID=1490 RepID=UPI00359CB16B